MKREKRIDPLGDGLTALCGGALALNLLLVVALLAVLAINGGGYFWQDPLLRVELDLRGQLLDHWGHHAARAAPGGPEVH